MESKENTQTVIAYLLVKNANDLIDFAKNVFDAEVIELRLRNETNDVMHAELMIGSSKIMVAEAVSEWKPLNNSLFIWVKDADKTYNKAIANGAVSYMPLSDFETRRISGVEDPFGNIWWITSILGK